MYVRTEVHTQRLKIIQPKLPYGVRTYFPVSLYYYSSQESDNFKKMIRYGTRVIVL